MVPSPDNSVKNITPAAFWRFHIGGWLVFVIFHFVHLKIMIKPENSDYLVWVVAYLTLLALLTLQRYIFKSLNYRDYKLITLVLIIFATAMILSFIRHMAVNLIVVLIRNDFVTFFKKFQLSRTINPTFFNSMIFIGWSGLYFGIKFWIEWNEQREQTQKAHTLAQKVQLQLLRYQINPHFLFNSLNSIRALISENKNNAKSMITELAEYLRYSLLSENIIEVPLNQEIEAIRHYYAIEKRRYENNLEIDFQIDPDTMDLPVISFLIHPLVENAIKYGMRTRHLPLKIAINTKLESDILKVAVINTGKWVEPRTGDGRKEDSTGTGLENVRRRLQSAYPGNHSFYIDKSDNRVCVRFEINRNCESYDEELI
ncbi:MAG: histidine kinase [Candidatus Neomarinimicrobiota bacterium]